MGSVEPTSMTNPGAFKSGKEPPPINTNSKPWEYWASAMPEGLLDDKIAWLNLAGTQGWELMFVEGWDPDAATGIAWFKRPA
jgi:hypothetical protein